MQDTLRDKTGFHFTMIPHEVIDDVRTFDDPSEKMVYMVLKRHANLNGENAFPSMSTIAAKAVCSESTVKRRIKSLVDKGLITKENRFDSSKGGKTSNLYTINDFNRWVTETYRDGSEGPNPSVSVTHERYTINDKPIKTATTTANDQMNGKDEQAATSETGLIDHTYQTAQEAYMKAGWGLPNPFAVEMLQDDIKDYGIDIVLHAIEIAATSTARSYRYTQSMYKEWNDKGLKNIEQVKQYEDAKTLQRQKDNERRQGVKPVGTSKPKPRDDFWEV